MSAPNPFAAEPAPTQRWLSIVGIGEDGVDGLGRGARDLIENAEIVFGGDGLHHPGDSPMVLSQLTHHVLGSPGGDPQQR